MPSAALFPPTCSENQVDTMDVVREVLDAEERIRPYIRETILDPSPHLSRMGGASVHLKLENLQFTGSFKARGAMSKLSWLPPEERARGVVAASTGNHGAAVARSAQELGATALIVAPENASAGKLAAVERLGGEVRLHGQDCAESEAYARQLAADQGMTYVSPYNDLHIVAGQGTIGVELARQLDGIDAVFVALGGGGLVSGIAAHLKSVSPKTKIFGCSPENSQVMIQSVRAGKILDLPSEPTLSDSTAGGLERGAVTFDLCRDLVDDYVTVTEDEIRESLKAFIEKQHMLIEGAAAVAVASYLKTRVALEGQKVVIVICGANIGLETLRSVV